MKFIKNLSSILILSGILFTSCGIIRKSPKLIDYSNFPKGTILTGEMKTGKTVYLIREDSTKMAGIYFVDQQRAVAEIIPFFADSTGATNFIHGNERFSGKIKINKSQEIELTLPDIAALEIIPQTIRLRYHGMVPERVDCPERYKNPIFQNIVAEKDIQYGTAPGYYTSKPSDYISNSDYRKWFSEMFSTSLQHRGFLFKYHMEQLPLMLDIYQPRNDRLKKRPLLLFIHGGAFFFGDKENRMQQIITDDLVKKGFVLASINYRLGTSITPGAIERAIYRDVQDTRAALRYLVHHKEKYGIDDQQIYLVGSSAGGIISLTTAFMDSNEVFSSTGRGLFRQREDLGGLDDSGNNLKNDFQIAGVASMWGGITNLEMLNNHIPTLLFHGTADRIVPHDEGLPFRDFMGSFIHRFLSSFGKIYGSERIYQQLKSINVPVSYIPFPGAGHDPHIEPDDTINEKMDVIRDELGNFLFDHVSKHYFNYRLTGRTAVGKQDAAPVYQIDNIGNSAIQWHVDGGLITNKTNDAIRVIWYNTHQTGTVTACITNENDVSCIKEMKVVIK